MSTILFYGISTQVNIPLVEERLLQRTKNAIFPMKNSASKGECKMIILHEITIGSYSQIMRILVKSSTEIQRTVYKYVSNPEMICDTRSYLTV